jgi:hypothetical protein
MQGTYHILDPVECQTATQREFETLVERIVLPPGLVDPFQDELHASIDRIAILQAMAVLLPWDARALLLPPLNAGKLDLEEIATMADLPLPNVAVVMSPLWDDIHVKLLRLKWPKPYPWPDPSGPA